MALRALGWSVDAQELTVHLDLEPPEIGSCWLSHLLEPKSKSLLTPAGRSEIQHLVAAGFLLLDRWPGQATKQTHRWIGSRLFLLTPSAHRRLSLKLNAIVASQLGKDFSRLTHWPRLLDWAMKSAARDQMCLLTTEGTTWNDVGLQFASAVNLPTLELVLENTRVKSKRESSIEGPRQELAATQIAVQWLARTLTAISSSADPISEGQKTPNTAKVYLSPNLNCQSLPEDISRTPLADRCLFALADRITVLAVRSGGTIEKLMKHRLDDSDLPPASCIVAIQRQAGQVTESSLTMLNWLDRGAVGYLVDMGPPNLSQHFGCAGKESKLSQRASQACMAMKDWLKYQPSWRYLTHCTRGNCSAWPQESSAGFIRRVWLDGEITTADPFQNLLHILMEGRLRGSNWLTRTNQPLVSLSAAPVDQLLCRRTFQSHLTRWDWEPYGIIFSHAHLLHAQAVRYGNETTFRTLDEEQRLFFQLAGGKRDWTMEQEWRVPGDINLQSIPCHAAIVFVKSKTEAHQAAQVSRFTVAWIE